MSLCKYSVKSKFAAAAAGSLEVEIRDAPGNGLDITADSHASEANPLSLSELSWGRNFFTPYMYDRLQTFLSNAGL